MAQAEILAGVLASQHFAEWAQIMVGKWALTGPTAEEQGTISVSLMPGGKALLTDNEVPTGGTMLIGHAVTVADPATGMIKQTEAYNDGSTEVTYITKVSSGQWAWRQTRTFADGTQETNVASFNFGNGGNNAFHNVSNRLLAGKVLPDKGHVLTRIG
ncbi:MAG: hypothetical protein LAO78_22390 [Acidobacteriia bacterium]|nr:hypothetical protein [Terriglobia bacterium]